ncbi:hypothetical protein [Noviluteimonas gilva]|uniref:Outer membrane protein beta-barrel domain-containing protein n=1 Tax=Noviluteimonas gilva TaxID=2682097 RepID=A0A7C9LW70_9GAMM|nr:hypothetical protein [Lysobacter gilvus]MUV13305.1 hypothetical protein [Lysobacter gilvus]
MKKQLLAAAALAFASFGACAQDITSNNLTSVSWTWVQASAARTSLDDADFSIDFDGWNVSGSVDVADEYHVFGAFQNTSNNDFVDFDLKEAQLGFGWHPKISANANAVVELSWIRQDLSADLFGQDIDDEQDNLYRVSAGVRGALGEHFVGTLKANYTDSNDWSSDGEFGGTVGAEVRFNRTWSLVGEADIAEHQDHYSVGVRASF